MSSLSDILEFEKFNLKDMWKKVKKDPERLFIGAADPYSSKLWGKVLGKDYEPIVDQMGGAYGGHTISAFGNQDGGVYKRAQDAGINTGPGAGMHDLAHIISASYAGGYGGGKLGGGGSSPVGLGNAKSTPNFGGTGGFNPMAGGGSSGPMGGLQQLANLPQMGQQQDPNAIQKEREERRKRELLAEILRRMRMQA